MDYSFLIQETLENGICILKISAPKSLNALNSEILKELDYFFSNLSDIRVVILAGDGQKVFVAGADISQMSNFNQSEAYEFSKFGAMVFRKIEELDIPVIAAINGFALGGGCELAMACDIRIAAENACFGQPEVKLGIIPGFSGTYRLSKIVGQGMAKELIFTGKVIKADEALRIGLVNKVVPLDILIDFSKSIAENILSNAPIAVKYAKKAINDNYDMSETDALELENKYFSYCFDTLDQKEGMKAFLGKQKPNFLNK